jgi:hypothetical protein
MQFMLLILDRKDDTETNPARLEEVRAFARELARQGTLRSGGLLHPETAGARVEVRDGKAVVSDGPFAESKHGVGGFLIVDAESRRAATEIGTRCPHLGAGIVEVHLLPDRDAARQSDGTQFVFLLHQRPDESDPDGSKYREMVTYDEELKREGRYVESSQLARDPAPARIERRGGRAVVTDGPFAESKELTGGYYVVEAADRAQAVELAKRCPHARWGTIEVREIVRTA